jgi:nitroimidazol reductase NimA-like FMN-containing flavoprotein (pyridoxamine 5'-phosphate oxidase superfamily)
MTRILASTNIGRMATVDAEGYPYITPVNFVFHEGCVYFHCAPKGEKLDNLTRDPRVCFEVSVPLAYLEVAFNPEKNPCRTHQLFHSVIIRGLARIVPEGELKTAALNALLAKHEGNRAFAAVTSDSPDNKACCVVEIRPERMTAKSDLAQNRSPENRRFIAENLAKRGLPGDLEAVRAMGFELEGSEGRGWRLKG